MLDYPSARQEAAMARCLRKRAALCRDVDQAVRWHMEAEDIEVRLVALHTAAMTTPLGDLNRVSPVLADLVLAAKPDSSRILDTPPHAGAVSEACHR